MDLRTIRSFKTIVELKSFQSAAEHLNYAQSTITSHIKKLEMQLGVTLFDRENNLRLTKAGILLNEKSNVLLQSFHQLENTMNKFIGGQSEVIRIGVMEPTASYRFPDILSKFVRQFTNIDFSLQVQGSKALMEMVRNNEIDIAICATPDAYSQTVFERLFTEKVVLLLNKDHPFNQKDDIYLSDLAGEELLITNRDCPFRGIFENKLIGNNCIPSYGLEVSNLLTLKYYVQSGFGPAIVPLISVTPPPENTVVKNIADFEDGLTIGILMKNSFEYSPSIKALIKMLKTEFVS